MAALLKSAESQDFVGSNPTLSATDRGRPRARGLPSTDSVARLREYGRVEMTLLREDGRALFGMRRRAPRPVLLVIVYGIFIAIVGVTAMAQTIMVSAQFSTSTINNVVGSDTALVRLFVTGALSPEDAGSRWAGRRTPGASSKNGSDAAWIPARSCTSRYGCPTGRVIASDRPGARGTVAAHHARLRDSPRAAARRRRGIDPTRRERGHGSGARACLGPA